MMAEHHSVWENEDGDLIDVTPPRHGGAQTLFLRGDMARVFGSNSEIQVLTNLADIKKGVFFRDGKIVSYSSCLLPEDLRELACEYAGKIGFDMARYSTDQQLG